MSSKYDVIKLKVHISSEHFYILSRFQLSRMLMFCKVPEVEAIRVALDVKRYFVNRDTIETTQKDLERVLEETLSSYGYQRPCTLLMPVITTFYSERVPLIILVSGSAGSGKTTMAGLLAARLNCNTVLNTEILGDVVDAVNTCSAVGTDVVQRVGSSSWRDRCDAVFSAVAAELDKALKEGKVLIVEGAHLDLSLYSRYLHRDQQEDPQKPPSTVIGIYLAGSPRSEAVNLVWGMGHPSGVSNATAQHEEPNCEAEKQRLTEHFQGRSGSSVGLRHLYLGAETDDESAALPSSSPNVWIIDVEAPQQLSSAAAIVHDAVVDRILSVLVAEGKLEDSLVASL